MRSARLAGEMDGQGPRRAANRVAGGFVRGERDAAELDGIAVAQHAIDLRGGNAGTALIAKRKSVRPPLSTTSASRSITMFFAPVSRRICAAPAMWSKCAWLLSRIFVSAHRNPSFSTLARICGGDVSRLALMRMFPAGVVTRYAARSWLPT
jgi:hypothetical protein